MKHIGLNGEHGPDKFSKLAGDRLESPRVDNRLKHVVKGCMGVKNVRYIKSFGVNFDNFGTSNYTTGQVALDVAWSMKLEKYRDARKGVG